MSAVPMPGMLTIRLGNILRQLRDWHREEYKSNSILDAEADNVLAAYDLWLREHPTSRGGDAVYSATLHKPEGTA